MPSKPHLKLFFFVSLPLFLISPLALHSLIYFANNPFPNFFQSKPQSTYYPPHLMICNKINPSSNYLGSSLVVSNFALETDIVLCPGDTFGELNETFLTVKNCYLVMYHKDQIIWSSKQKDHWPGQDICAVSLQKDGNLALFQENRFSEPEQMEKRWESKTNFNPPKTELRLQGQQIRIIQTFKDGTQRLFYADADHQGFMEDLGQPKKIADRSVIKDHRYEDRTILRRNEYIGDLNGTHLILQTNCELQLRNKNKMIWSFAFFGKHEMNCSFNLQGGYSIGISKIGRPDPTFPSLREQSIIRFRDLPRIRVLQSQILLEEDRLIIIQALQDGTERRFHTEPGEVHGWPKEEPRKIAQNNITVSSFDPHRNS